MSHTDILVALSTHLLTLSDVLPLAFENRKLPNTRPYMIEENMPLPTIGFGLANTGTKSLSGQYKITIVWDTNKYSHKAQAEGDRIIEHFPRGLRLDLQGGGTVLVSQEPYPIKAYPDGSDWRLPIVVPYKT